MCPFLALNIFLLDPGTYWPVSSVKSKHTNQGRNPEAAVHPIRRVLWLLEDSERQCIRYVLSFVMVWLSPLEQGKALTRDEFKRSDKYRYISISVL